MLLAEAADIAVAEVIGDYQDDVGWLRGMEEQVASPE